MKLLSCKLHDRDFTIVQFPQWQTPILQIARWQTPTLHIAR